MGKWDNHWPCQYCGSYDACNCEAERDAERVEEREIEEKQRANEQLARENRMRELRPSVEKNIVAKYSSVLYSAGFFKRRALRHRIKKEIQKELENLVP